MFNELSAVFFIVGTGGYIATFHIAYLALAGVVRAQILQRKAKYVGCVPKGM